mmetsp:Transcript_15723/g.23602  ORF Transcript_15723/g.23602 Transcript_15723/m.23602 type:complete len:81 (-) Transcript_15723:45-287(-)
MAKERRKDEEQEVDLFAIGSIKMNGNYLTLQKTLVILLLEVQGIAKQEKGVRSATFFVNVAMHWKGFVSSLRNTKNKIMW